MGRSRHVDFQPRWPSRFQVPTATANAAMSFLQIFEDTKLDAMLDLFKLGRTHMVMVMHINNDVRRVPTTTAPRVRRACALFCSSFNPLLALVQVDTDPVREIVGIATLEDVIEEIIQAEIIDETDRVGKASFIIFLVTGDAQPYTLAPRHKLTAPCFTSSLLHRVPPYASRQR